MEVKRKSSLQLSKIKQDVSLSAFPFLAFYSSSKKVSAFETFLSNRNNKVHLTSLV